MGQKGSQMQGERVRKLRARGRQRARFRDDGVDRDSDPGTRQGMESKARTGRQAEPERKWDTESKENSEKERDPEGKRWGEGIRRETFRGKRIWGERERLAGED